MAGPKVFVFAPADQDSLDRLEAAGCELVRGTAGWASPLGNSEDELVDMARDAVALAGTTIKSARISRRVMQASDKLRIIAKYSVGYDEVDLDAAAELGVLVTHAPTEANWGAVAEHTMATMLALLKKLGQRDRAVRAGRWRDPNLAATYLGRRDDGYAGITIGIVGLGRIGGRVAKLLEPWRARVIACDPYIDPQRFVEHGVEPVDLDTLLRESDFVSMHVTLTPQTRHMIGREQLRLMKPTAMLQNNARGPVVDEAALADALRDGQIAAAAIDVFEHEPLPADSPLRDVGDKVLLTPHMSAGCLHGGLHEGCRWAADGVLEALRGRVPQHVVNPSGIEKWRTRFEGRSAFDD
jgi:phosphoglycerate dehydrogenase-like enzyme